MGQSKLKLRNYRKNAEKGDIYSLNKIKNEDVLYDIARNNKKYHTRLYAVKNNHLNDDKKLLNIINEEKGYQILITATAKIKNEQNLINLIKNHPDWHVRSQAIQNNNLRNQKVLTKSAVKDEDYMVRREAVKHVENQDLLVYLSRNDKDAMVRISSIKKIRNMDIVVYAARHDSNWRVRKAAIDEIDDIDVLKDLLDNEEDIYLQDYLNEKIDWLEKI